jgi:tetratricopeptide (TPR) repeat protein
MSYRLNRRIRYRHRSPLSAAIIAAVFACAGCGDQNAANQKLIAAQQQQIEQNQRELEALAAQQQQNQSYPRTAAPPGTCDPAVAKVATARGGQRMAAGDFSKALGYYQDALTACPNMPQGELNVAKACEALGDREHAIEYYKKAAASGDSTVALQAQNALSHLNGAR